MMIQMTTTTWNITQKQSLTILKAGRAYKIVLLIGKVFSDGTKGFVIFNLIFWIFETGSIIRIPNKKGTRWSWIFARRSRKNSDSRDSLLIFQYWIYINQWALVFIRGLDTTLLFFFTTFRLCFKKLNSATSSYSWSFSSRVSSWTAATVLTLKFLREYSFDKVDSPVSSLKVSFPPVLSVVSSDCFSGVTGVTDLLISYFFSSASFWLSTSRRLFIFLVIIFLRPTPSSYFI